VEHVAILFHPSGLHQHMNPACTQGWLKELFTKQIPEWARQHTHLKFHMFVRGVSPPAEVVKQKYIDKHGKFKGQGAALAKEQGMEAVDKFNKDIWSFIQGLQKQHAILESLLYADVYNVVVLANQARAADQQADCHSRCMKGKCSPGESTMPALRSCDGTHPHEIVSFRATQLVLNQMRLALHGSAVHLDRSKDPRRCQDECGTTNIKCNAEYCRNFYGPGQQLRGRCVPSHQDHHFALAECSATCGLCSEASLDPTHTPRSLDERVQGHRLLQEYPL